MIIEGGSLAHHELFETSALAGDYAASMTVDSTFDMLGELLSEPGDRAAVAGLLDAAGFELPTTTKLTESEKNLLPQIVTSQQQLDEYCYDFLMEEESTCSLPAISTLVCGTTAAPATPALASTTSIAPANLSAFAPLMPEAAGSPEHALDEMSTCLQAELARISPVASPQGGALSPSPASLDVTSSSASNMPTVFVKQEPLSDSSLLDFDDSLAYDSVFIGDLDASAALDALTASISFADSATNFESSGALLSHASSYRNATYNNTPTTTNAANAPQASTASFSFDHDTTSSSSSVTSQATSPDISSADINRLKFSPHVLPPCRVCGAQATGYHYGANTCEPCKGFYHRMTKRADRADLVCLKHGRCVINVKNRGACPACRYRKCVEAGMCKGNIKTGRYSYSKRSRDILELQQSLRAKHNGAATAAVATGSSFGVAAFEAPVVSAPQQHSPQHQRPAYSKQESCSTLSACSSLSSSSSFSLLTAADSGAHSLSAEEEKKSRDIMATLRAANDKVRTKLASMNYAAAPALSEAIGAFTRQQFASPETCEAYDQLIRLIAGSFKQNVWSAFIKAIPGFKQLPMCDQIQVIKHGFLDFWVISCCKNFDTDNFVYTVNEGLRISLKNLLDEEEATSLVNAAKRLQELRLSVEESCALAAFTVLNTDSAVFSSPAQVQELRMDLLNALVYALQQNRARPMVTYARIINALVQLRSVFHTTPQCIRSLPDTLTPSIFREIIQKQ